MAEPTALAAGRPSLRSPAWGRIGPNVDSFRRSHWTRGVLLLSSVVALRRPAKPIARIGLTVVNRRDCAHYSGEGLPAVGAYAIPEPHCHQAADYLNSDVQRRGTRRVCPREQVRVQQNVDKVVYPPSSPTKMNSRQCICSVMRLDASNPDSSPITRHPETLTTIVPPGKRVVSQCV